MQNGRVDEILSPEQELYKRGFLRIPRTLDNETLKRGYDAIGKFPKPTAANKPGANDFNLEYCFIKDIITHEAGYKFVPIAVVTFENGRMNFSMRQPYIDYLNELSHYPLEAAQYTGRGGFLRVDDRLMPQYQASPESIEAAKLLFKHKKEQQEILDSFKGTLARLGYLSYFDLATDSVGGTVFSALDYLPGAELDHSDNMRDAISILIHLGPNPTKCIINGQEIIQMPGELIILDNHGSAERPTPDHAFFGGEEGRRSFVCTLYGKDAEKFIAEVLPDLQKQGLWTQPTDSHLWLPRDLQLQGPEPLQR